MPPNIEGFIDDRNDLISYSAWLLGEMNDWQSNPHDLREELSDIEVDEAFEEIRSMVDSFMDDYEAAGFPEDVNSVIDPSIISSPYQRFIFLLSDGAQEKYFWHMWKSSDTILEIKQKHIDTFDGFKQEDLGKPVGHSEKLQSSILLQNSALIQHAYDSKPEPVSWKLTPVRQGSAFTVYFGCQKFSEIDAVGKVPWINPRYSSHNFASKVLLGMLSKEDEWQRLVDIGRIHEIRDFAHGSDNYMVNPTLLYANQDHPSVHFNEDGCILTVDFEFLGDRAGSFFDFLPYPKEEDRRPLWIVDGQHRIRGFGASPRGSTLDAPFILIVGDGEDDARTLVAKIFTEINTTARPLDKMHQTYLRYEFKIGSKSSANDYSVDDQGQSTESSRSNRLSYELALNLAADQDSPLYNSVQFQDPAKSTAKLSRMKRHLIVKSTNWMQISKSWFRTGGIYSDSESDRFYSEEVKNFFIAFAETCNHVEPVATTIDEWTDGKNRWMTWEERRKKKPIIQQQGPFRALMHMVDYTVRELLRSNPTDTERPFSVMQFKRALSPLSNIDWLNDDALSKLKGRGNLSVPHLRMWMEEAISGGEVHSVEDILNREKMSEPGKGINAPPSNENLIIDLWGDGEPWPGQLPLQVSMDRPLHSLRARWGVEVTIDDRRFPIVIDKAWYSQNDRRSILSIEKGALPPGTEALHITGRWSNGIDDAIAEPRHYMAP